MSSYKEINNNIDDVKNKINILIKSLINIYPKYKLINDSESQTQYNSLLSKIDKEINGLLISKDFFKSILKEQNTEIKKINLELEFLEDLNKKIKEKYIMNQNLNLAYEPREKYYEYTRIKSLVFMLGQMGLTGILIYLIIRLIYDKK